MHVLGETNEAIAARLQLLGPVLFNSQSVNGRFQVETIAAALPGEDPNLLRQSLRRLDDQQLIYFDGQSNVELYGLGKYVYERGCIPEFVLGFGYIDEKYRNSVIRIVITKPNGDPAAGTGFFISDPPNCIVTNRHVAE